jgi:hypothetical protein
MPLNQQNGRSNFALMETLLAKSELVLSKSRYLWLQRRDS